jgi:hypothetical protein
LIEASELRILEPRVVLQSVVADLHRARIAFDLDPVQDAQVLKIDGVRKWDPRLDREIECGRGFVCQLRFIERALPKGALDVIEFDRTLDPQERKPE